jgi:hypothetical protein
MEPDQFDIILQHFHAVEAQLALLLTTERLVSARTQVHEEILAQLAASIGRMDTYAAQHDARMAQVDARMAQHETRMAQHESDLAELKEFNRQQVLINARLEVTMQGIKDLLERRNGR